MKKIIVILNTLFIIFLSAQTQKSFRFPSVNSPETSSLGKFGDYPVGLNTGTVNVDIPLYIIKSGDIEVPISISYHTSGIKVDQESSNVGLGWNLNAGGVINRVIKDKDDLSSDGGFSYIGNQIPDYNDISEDSFIVGHMPAYNYQTGINNPLDALVDKDTNPDIFSINSNLINGSFALDNNGIPNFLEYSDLKIDYSYHTDNGEKIKIIDGKGNVFLFGKNENGDRTTEYSTNTFDVVISVNPPSDTPTARTEPKYISSWWLTDIISPSGKKITFKYKEYEYRNYIVSGSARYSLGASGVLISSTDQIGQNFEGETINYMNSVINTRVIDKIIFDEGTVEFNHIKDRQDIYQSSNPNPRISGVTVYDNNLKIIKKISFENNDYFQRTANGSMYTKQISNYERKSLKLNSVRFINSNETFDNAYQFEYDLTPLPPRNTAGQDYWGYYNGKANSTLIPDYTLFGFHGNPIYVGANKETDFNFMKSASLTKVKYPTGGSTSYLYEPNYYIKKDSNGQTTVQKTKTEKLYAMANSSKCVIDPELPNSIFAGLQSHTTKDIYVPENVIGSLRVNVWFSDYELTQGQAMLFNLNVGNQTRNFKHIPSEKSNYKYFTQTIPLYTGNHILLDANTNGVGGNAYKSPCNTPFIDASVSYDYLESIPAAEAVPSQAGGLRVTEIKNFNENGGLISKRNYVYGDSAYGSNNTYVGKLITDPRANIYKQKQLYYELQTKAEQVDVVWITSNSMVELGTNNGCPVDYNKVTEYIEDVNDTTKKQKIEHFFSGLRPNILPNASETQTATYVFPEWRKSVLEKNIFYKNENNVFSKVKEEYFRYTAFPEKRVKNLVFFVRGDKLYHCSDNTTSNGGFGLNCLLFSDRYWVANMYLPFGKSVLTEKEDINYFSAGNSISTKSLYYYNNLSNYQLSKQVVISPDATINETSYKYAHEKANQKLIDANIIGIPLETSTVQKKDANDVSGKLISKNETRYDNPTNLFPTSVLSYDLQNGTTPSTEVTYDTYDSKGNLQQYTTKDGISSTIIWGYNNTQPIAKIVGAKLSDIQQSFIDSIVNASNTDALATPNNDETSFLSVLNTFKNNLPNYQVSTYTYDPLIGVRSITPPSGIREVYIYDTANRLKEIRENDATGKLLKEFKYNYKN